MEAGEPPPPPPPPPPPTPEQEKQMALEQKKAEEELQKNIEMARKNEVEDHKAQLESAKFDHERMMLPAIAELQDQLRAERAKSLGLTAQLQAASTFEQRNALEAQQSNTELARQNEIEDRKTLLEAEKLEHERMTLPALTEMQDQLRAERSKALALTTQLEQSEAAAQDQAREAQQNNVELARKNTIEDSKVQLETEKHEYERMTLPALSELQERLRVLTAQKTELEHQRALDDVDHRVGLGELKSQFMQLQDAIKAKQEESDQQLAEMTQKNIEQARANQLAEDSHGLERRKIDLEHTKLTSGEQDDADAAGAAQAEQVQTNIEQARANELGEKQHSVALKELDFKDRQGKRDEERSKREHELALNPPAEPTAAPAQATSPQVETEVAALKSEVNEITEGLKDLMEMVGTLSERVNAVQATPPAAEPAESAAPAEPAETPTDHTPKLLDIIGKFAQRRAPSGVKRTPDGMSLIYDEEEPSEEPPVG
jgi:hypothetical protein